MARKVCPTTTDGDEAHGTRTNKRRGERGRREKERGRSRKKKQLDIAGNGTTVVPTSADAAGVVAAGETALARQIEGAKLKTVDPLRAQQPCIHGGLVRQDLAVLATADAVIDLGSALVQGEVNAGAVSSEEVDEVEATLGGGGDGALEH